MPPIRSFQLPVLLLTACALAACTPSSIRTSRAPARQPEARAAALLPSGSAAATGIPFHGQPLEPSAAGACSAGQSFLPPIRWTLPDSAQSIVFRVNYANAPLDRATTRLALQSAIDAWNASGASIHLAIGGETELCGLDADGTSVISFGPCSAGGGGTGPGGAVAIGTPYFRDGPAGGFGAIVEGDVLVYESATTLIRQMGVNGLAEILAHEIGHTLGFNHSPDPGALMYACMSGRGPVLGEDDLDELEERYPLVELVTPSPLPPARLGQFYSLRLEARFGARPYRWKLKGELPLGLSLSEDGLISGFAQAGGQFKFKVRVEEAWTQVSLGRKGKLRLGVE